MKQLCITAIACILLTGIISAQENEKEDSVTIESATHIITAVTFPLGIQVNINNIVKIPVLNFSNPLMRSNNITFKIGAELTPLTLEGKFDIIWTPIAFFELYTGVSTGSGWSINELHGLALNTDRAGKTVKIPIDFSRTFYSVNFGGAFQFDLGAIIPGNWTHIVLRSDQYIVYKGVSATSFYESWIFKNDEGQNRNGLTYFGVYTLGYQMPLPINLVALRVETEKSFFKVPAGRDKRDWGEDRYSVLFGPVIHFKATQWLAITLIAQWKTIHVYHSTNPLIFYQNRIIDKSKQDNMYFKRVGIIFDCKIPHH